MDKQKKPYVILYNSYKIIKFFFYKKEVVKTTDYLLIEAENWMMATAIAVQYLTNRSKSTKLNYKIIKLENLLEAQMLPGDYKSPNYQTKEPCPKILYHR